MKNRVKTILSLIFIFLFLFFISFFYGVFWGILGLTFLLFSLHSYYFPTHYEVNSEEVIIKNIFTTQRRKLGEFKKIYQGKNGVLLSPFKHKTFLNYFRGVFLLLPANRKEILEYLKGLFTVQEGTKDNVESRV